MSRKLNSVQNYSDTAFVRNRIVVIHGILEPFKKAGKQRGMSAWYHVVNLLRTIEMPMRLLSKVYFAWKDSREPVTLDAGSHG